MRFFHALSISLLLAVVRGQTPAEKAKAMLDRMNLDEKITMCHGSGGGYTGNVPQNTRLGIPPLNLNDGPQGFRTGGSTCWPGDLTVGATWDVKLAGKFGTDIGKEFYDKGSNVMLGPGLNVARVPTNGRNFEYISGEDPFLGWKMVQPVVKGIQGSNVIANCKHYIQNNQEIQRGSINAEVDERTRFEMYYPPFEGAVEAGLGSIMCSYNKINGRWSCENNSTLHTDLKHRTGFKGWVMSDWGGTHSTSINQGLDQEMPGGDWMGWRLKDMVNSGAVSQATLDESVLRMLTPMYEFGIFDHAHQWTNSSAHGADVTSPAHSLTARQLAAAASVLLKNNGVLPLNNKPGHVALIGKDATNPTVHGGGSGQVGPTYVISPMGGIRERMGGKPNCTFDQDTDYYTTPSSEHSASSPTNCCENCFADGNCAFFTFVPPSTCWYHSNIGQKKPHTGYTSGSCGSNSANISFADGGNVNTAVNVAKAADVAIVFVSTSSSEGGDRSNLDYPSDQIAVAAAVIKAQPNTIVVCVNPGAVLIPWAKDAAAIITMFMPGLEMGHGLADVLFGDVNPSGRLPVTFPNKNNEIGFTREQYPGTNGNAVYSEKLLVGYRWYDHNNVTPLFPFGHGLSYTNFTYSDLHIDGTTISFVVTNSGQIPGAEVAQLYLGFPTTAGEPPFQLKEFEKTEVLEAGEKATIKFELPDRSLSTWDVNTHGWKKESGEFTVHVGASSRDVRLKGSFTV